MAKAKQPKNVQMRVPREYTYEIIDRHGDVTVNVGTDPDDTHLTYRLSDPEDDCVMWLDEQSLDGLVWVLKDCKERVNADIKAGEKDA